MAVFSPHVFLYGYQTIIAGKMKAVYESKRLDERTSLCDANDPHNSGPQLTTLLHHSKIWSNSSTSFDGSQSRSCGTFPFIFLVTLVAHKHRILMFIIFLRYSFLFFDINLSSVRLCLVAGLAGRRENYLVHIIGIWIVTKENTVICVYNPNYVSCNSFILT